MPSFMFIDAPLFRGPHSGEGQTIINPDFVTVIFLGEEFGQVGAQIYDLFEG